MRAEASREADRLYADLRVKGEIAIDPADAKNTIQNLRHRAAKDGLRVVSSRPRPDHRRQTSWQIRQRPYYVALTEPGSDLIVRPDA